MRKGGRQQKELSTRPQPATIEENLIELLGTRGRGLRGISFSTKNIPKGFYLGFEYVCIFICFLFLKGRTHCLRPHRL